MDFRSYPPAHFTPLKRRGGFLLATDFTDYTDFFSRWLPVARSSWVGRCEGEKEAMKRDFG